MRNINLIKKLILSMDYANINYVVINLIDSIISNLICTIIINLIRGVS